MAVTETIARRALADFVAVCTDAGALRGLAAISKMREARGATSRAAWHMAAHDAGQAAVSLCEQMLRSRNVPPVNAFFCQVAFLANFGRCPARAVVWMANEINAHNGQNTIEITQTVTADEWESAAALSTPLLYSLSRQQLDAGHMATAQDTLRKVATVNESLIAINRMRQYRAHLSLPGGWPAAVDVLQGCGDGDLAYGVARTMLQEINTGGEA